MNKRKEFLKNCKIKAGEEHHIKQARFDYICKGCGMIIYKKSFYYAVLSTLPIGYRRICNVIIARICINCAKDNKGGFASMGDFNEN